MCLCVFFFTIYLKTIKLYLYRTVYRQSWRYSVSHLSLRLNFWRKTRQIWNVCCRQFKMSSPELNKRTKQNTFEPQTFPLGKHLHQPQSSLSALKLPSLMLIRASTCVENIFCFLRNWSESNSYCSQSQSTFSDILRLICINAFMKRLKWRVNEEHKVKLSVVRDQSQAPVVHVLRSSLDDSL